MPGLFRILSVTALLTVAAPATALADDIPNDTRGEVEKIESGEVLVVKLADGSKRVKVRVIGIECEGSRSKSAAAQLVGRTEIVLKSDKSFLPILQDQNDRYVAYVEMKDGRDFGMEMLRSGQCSTHGWNIPHPKKASYASVE